MHVRVAIVGSGFSGLGAAISLKQSGSEDFVIFERASDVGGTWRDNTYPGCACDVESHLYSFSFAPNPEWSRMFSSQPEIWAYLQRCARDFGILPHVRFGHEVLSARWNAAQRRWQIETSAGSYSADILIAAMGALSEPSMPALPGLERFAGPVFHSARWRHDYPLEGRKVAVIGTGASAVQFVPIIQQQVQKLTLFQRTPAWVIPRLDRAYSALSKRLFAGLPALHGAVRTGIYLRREWLVLLFRHPRWMKLFELYAQLYLRLKVPEPALRKKLMPSFRIGCKRVLISDDYLPALSKPNVELVTSGIREVREHAIVSEDGVEHAVDAIILGTGFHATDMPFADRVLGSDGRSLNEHWQGSPEAHLGTMVTGFPNLFLLLGPNTGLGHTSVIYMMESQLMLLMATLKFMSTRGVATVEPTAAAQRRFIEELQDDMEGTVWTSGNCASWYLDRTGRNSSLWPSYTFAFRHKMQFRPAEYHLGTTRRPLLKRAKNSPAAPN